MNHLRKGKTEMSFNRQVFQMNVFDICLTIKLSILLNSCLTPIKRCDVISHLQFINYGAKSVYILSRILLIFLGYPLSLISFLVHNFLPSVHNFLHQFTISV